MYYHGNTICNTYGITKPLFQNGGYGVEGKDRSAPSAANLSGVFLSSMLARSWRFNSKGWPHLVESVER